MNHLNDHKGTYRNERFPKALHPDYFKLDERFDSDIIEQTAQLALYIKYYNEQNQVDVENGDWKLFFEDIYDYVHKKVNFQQIEEWEKNRQTPPHLALLLAFVQVFHIAQDELNRLSQRHLEYYYNNILKFERKKAVADKVAVFFEMDKKASIARIPKGTIFDGGNDNNGKKRLYVSDYDVVVNKAEIRQVKILTTDIDVTSGIVMLKKQDDLLSGLSEMPAEIGVVVSSPMFYLADGKRTITLHLNDNYKYIATSVGAHAIISYTSDNGWEEIPKDNIWDNDEEDGLTLIISKAMPSVVKYDESKHGLQIDAKDPVLRLVFPKLEIPEGYVNVESFLASFTAHLIAKIEVNVEESKDLLIYNDYGKLNGNMAFMPLGPNPIMNSCFYIGNNKIFNKYFNGNSFQLNVEWKGLPAEVDEAKNYICKYYAPYKAACEQFGNVGLYKASDFDFSNFDKESILKISRCLTHGEWKNGLNFSEEADSIRETITDFTAQTKFGFIGVELNVDFGHSVYNTLLSKVLMENVKNNMPQEGENAVKESPLAIPEKPYTPEIQSISVDYKLEDSAGDYQIFSLHPFVNKEVHAEETLFPVLPDDTLNGLASMKYSKSTYIALSNISPQDEVNVYFDMCENTPYQENQHFIWGYYNGINWTKLDEKLIVRDTTNLFRQSGIITFIIPEEIYYTGEGVFWLRLSMVGQENSFPEIRKVRAHCVVATFQNQDNELTHLKFGLPAFTILKMEERNRDIKSIEQPYPSFNGKEEENNDDFYARISERLRHKNRASSAWDYEHLVLEAFPQISFALCMSHSEIKEKKMSIVPGSITLLVSPDTEMLPQENFLEPMVPEQLLTQIKDYIKTLASPHVNVSVMNFAYKPVMVHCEVQLKKGYNDTSFYHDKLNADLVNYMSPWTTEDKETELKGWMYRSRNVADIYYFLENLEYIDYVISAYVTKDGKSYSIADKSLSDDENAIGKEPFEIFTSVTNHDIRIVYNG